MAKGQVSDDELSSGLKSLGGFAAISGARTAKDSPFRDSRSAPKVVEVARPVQPPAVVEAPVAPAAVHLVEEAKPKAPKTKPKIDAGKKERAGKQPATGRRVADIYTERVTLQMSPEMRDEIDALARELQRSKIQKGERITANTVMRVAISAVMHSFRFANGETANSEAELLSLVKKKLKHS